MRRTFCVAICGVRLWNSLSVGLKTVQIEPNLKRNIKRGFTIHTEMEEGGGVTITRCLLVVELLGS